MNQDSSNQKFRKILFWFTALFFAAHILLTLQFIFFKADVLPGSLNSFYKKLIALGPFFSDTRIKTSPHLYVSHLSSAGNWSSFHDISQENFDDFQQHQWRYHNSKWGEYQRYVARKAYAEIDSLKQIDGSEGVASAELIRYISIHHDQQSDSIKLLYVWNTWQPKSKSILSDTAFRVVFKPVKSGLPK